jgi:hypothetical protein
MAASIARISPDRSINGHRTRTLRSLGAQTPRHATSERLRQDRRRLNDRGGCYDADRSELEGYRRICGSAQWASNKKPGRYCLVVVVDRLMEAT